MDGWVMDGGQCKEERDQIGTPPQRGTSRVGPPSVGPISLEKMTKSRL